MTDTDQVRPLELLTRAADWLGAVVCLTSTRDTRVKVSGRKLASNEPGSRLSKLVVVIPVPKTRAPDMPRWTRLARGTVVAQADIVDAVPLNDAALALAEELGQRITALRRGTRP